MDSIKVYASLVAAARRVAGDNQHLADWELSLYNKIASA